MSGLQHKLVNIAMLPQPAGAVGVSCALLRPSRQSCRLSIAPSFPTQCGRTKRHDTAFHLASAITVLCQPSDGVFRKVYPAFPSLLGNGWSNGDVMFFGV